LSASVRSLTIRAWHPGVGALFEAGAWSQLRRLSLYGGAKHSHVDGDTTRPSVTDEDVERLARSGALEQLEALELDANLLSDAAAMALADSGMLGQLRELGLMENQIGDVGVAALIERGGMTRLEVLRLSRNLIGDAGAAAIARGPITLAAFRELARAELHWNRIGLAGIQALLRSPLIHEIEELDMSCDTLTHEDILALAADPALANLHGVLRAYVRDDSEETWQALIDSPHASQGTRALAMLYAESRRERMQP
jgi:Ran GTPase-activating protein (RanGAP) involved in mRNA processing and transport